MPEDRQGTASGMPDHRRTSASLALLAQQSGLWQIGIRPRLVPYLGELWRFRQFIRVLARSRAYAENQNSYLGQLWAIVTPILNATVYVIVFGLILSTDRGVDNVIAFIVIGVFMFRFFERSVVAGGKSISEKLDLVRALHFPRAVLPIAAVATELATLIPSLLVMAAIILVTGFLPGYEFVSITPEWLLLPVIVILFSIFNAGCAMIAARIVAATPDIMNVIQFIMRFIFYGSGVLFSISHYAPASLLPAMNHQPVALFLSMTRQALTQEPTMPLDFSLYIWALGWAALFLIGGFLFFWRGEERYGRE
ncbi:ABC transporter permease [Pseudactinotalea sp. Z1739]|uniref:ABC transporter permease n=1 Tax=Micrococcales TaxID=85006 RepID=UPI003C7BB08F